jgi:hypothetical protein
MSTRLRVRWWRLVDWRVVAAAGLPVWAAVIGFVAWDKAHPRADSATPAAVTSLPTLAVTAPVALPTPAPSDDQQAGSPDSRVIVVPYPVTRPVKAVRPARDVPFWLRDESGEPPALESENADPDAGCQTHGTAVKFVKSPTEAMSRARREDKLVCVLHLSGNLEDDGFT